VRELEDGAGRTRRQVFSVETGDRLVTDVTDVLASFVAGSGDGLLNAFLPHATAGLAVMELGSGTEEDLRSILSMVLPLDWDYRHRHGHRGHGRDHVLPVLVTPSLTLPVERGRLLLGTWQSVVIVDTNTDNRRRELVLTYLGG
jgi:secondary thiamine-phosphate synthase enzyme